MKPLRLFSCLLVSLLIWGCASHEPQDVYNKDLDSKVDFEKSQSVVQSLLSSEKKTFEGLPLEWWVIKRIPNKPAFLKADSEVVALHKADIKIAFQDLFVDTKVSLEFEPSSGHLLLNYPFLPGTVMNDFIMTIGSRKIRAVIMEESEAKEVYDAARQAGLKATLINQTQFSEMTLQTQVKQKEKVKLAFSYSGTALQNDGKFKFKFPGFLKSGQTGLNVELTLPETLKNFKSSQGELLKTDKQLVKLKGVESLEKGLLFEFDFDVEDRLYTSEQNGKRVYVGWQNGKFLFDQRLNPKQKSSAIRVQGQSLFGVVALHQFIRMKQNKFPSSELIKFAMQNKLLTDLTSQLAVDTFR